MDPRWHDRSRADSIDAMVLERQGQPLAMQRRLRTAPGRGEVALDVRACGVCRTDLHVCDGELSRPRLPLILGHEVVGVVTALGEAVTDLSVGDRVGVPWLGHTCGTCRFCVSGRENLCTSAEFTGYTRDGGYAQACVADARYCFVLPERYDDAHAAPLLCAGLIGFRAYRLLERSAKRIGFYGFGAAAHVLTQLAKADGREVFAFTRPGDARAQRFALRVGAVWSGGSDEAPPVTLDAAILFAPIGALVPRALAAVDAGGTVVAAGIHMSDVPQFAYELLWHERTLRSVANLTRQDGVDFFARIESVPIETTVQTYALREANAALHDLRAGSLEGAAVLLP